MKRYLGQPDTSLHSMDPTGRFSDRVEMYRRCRPDYPARVIDAALAGLGEPGGLVAADVGAGTGISARLLAARGLRVFAIEPNGAMREAGRGEPLASEGAGEIEWIDATAESTGLAPRSVDVVVCAQAFHWFRHREALDEFARVLKRRTASGAPGRLALVWNDRDARDAFTAEYSRLIRAVSGGHGAERDFDPTSIVEAHGGFGPVRLVEAAHSQRLTEEGVVGRAMSASYVPKEGPAQQEFERALRVAVRRHGSDGGASLVYVTRVYLADAL